MDSLSVLVSHQVPGSSVWPSLDDASQRALTAAVAEASSGSRVLWYPGYGCAVICVPELLQDESLTDLSLLLVGLDEWKFMMHR